MDTCYIVDLSRHFDLWSVNMTDTLGDSNWLLESEVERWLDDNGIAYQTLRDFALVFRHERDRTLFILRWT